MDIENKELDNNFLSAVSGGLDKNINAKYLTPAQAKDYQKHGSTVVYFEEGGIRKCNNGQIINFDRPGFYLLYYD